ncbi:MAG: hypothetical protein R6V85_19250 [Polyangia bacterium]
MAEKRYDSPNRLTERMVRNEDIFCSLLFDHSNSTIRVVDFRGGNFQTKHAYLEGVLRKEGMRKLFTLIERDDMNGWQRVGYAREGTIPGYYKRSDAYVMSRLYEEDAPRVSAAEDASEKKELVAEIKEFAAQISGQKGSGIKTEPVDDSEVVDLIRHEQKAAAQRAGKGKKTGRGKKGRKGRAASKIELPVFSQFSREVERYYFASHNRRTKQSNVFGAEYQDCFGNAKVDVFFSPTNRSERSLARFGLNAFVEWLGELGAVATFSLVRGDDLEMNAVYAGAGFRNSGLLRHHFLSDDGPLDALLWTRKLN